MPKLYADSNNPPIGAIVAIEIAKPTSNVQTEIIWTKEPGQSGNLRFVNNEGTVIGKTSNDVARYAARVMNTSLYGQSHVLDKTEVDHWLSLTLHRSVEDLLPKLNQDLATRTWLVAKCLTIADIIVFGYLYPSQRQGPISAEFCNVARWYKQLLAISEVQKALDEIVKNASITNQVPSTTRATHNNKAKSDKSTKMTNGKKEQGKFIELPGAEMGKVVVRFPPEASGFLHIGHAKAALLNQYYAEAFKGQLIMRFDDTNPAKENVEFEKAILEDLEMLRIKPDRFTHSSDYFDLMLEYCTKLMKEGKAFVDDTPAAQMKEEREQRLPSSNRDNSVEKNLKLWNEMQQGTLKGQECCVRAKIDFASVNGCMRDPTIYRCKPEPHPRTGTKYKVYPTYDFACPIVDVVEGVTHTLRTTEYHDRDEQFYWFVEALSLSRPYIWEYSRLNMTNTVLSKRKLTWFVAEGLVDGWDDPRFPTVRGILRRGMTVDGLKQFIIAQGSSRSVVFMEWDKIWAFNKKVIDPIAIRYTALDSNKTVPVTIEGATEGVLTAQNHPKDPAIGTKQVQIGPNVLIEQEDADILVEGQNATFINWGNIMIRKLKKENGKVVAVEASLNLDNKDFKNTPKLTWLTATKNNAAQNTIPCYTVYFEHIMSKAVLGKDDEFKDFVAKDTRHEIPVIGESELRRVKKGEIIQLQRKGFFRCDVPYESASPLSSREQPLILFHIPDGHATTTSKSAPTKVVAKDSKPTPATASANDVNTKIVEQGNKVRELKTAKADKGTIDAAVKVLLDLKAQYKSLTGTDWKPGCVPPTPPTPSPATGEGKTSAADLNEQITAQGNRVRELKSAKADKSAVDAAVKVLLDLKAQYKTITGTEWKPGCVPPTSSPVAVENKTSAADLNEQITAQGNKVRELKSAKADKSTVDAAVKVLLDLKGQYKTASGTEWKPGCVPPKPSPTTVESKISAADLNEQITAQGNKVRELKSAKADKSSVDAAVKVLLDLKGQYKAATGTEWKPGCVPPTPSPAIAENKTSAVDLNEQITAQGNKVRELKSAKADKSSVDAAVKVLLDLKGQYKAATGTEWKPGCVPPTSNSSASDNKLSAADLSEQITAQGNKVRELKSAKADKSAIDAAVKILLDLKSQYKTITGTEWKPTAENKTAKEATPPKKTVSDSKTMDNTKGDALNAEIKKQGDKVRELKTAKAEKAILDKEIQILLGLKNDYKAATGEDWKPANSAQTQKSKSSDKAQKKADSQKKVQSEAKDAEGSKTGTRLGLEAKKSENLADWYSQVITKGEMIEYYDVSGCYILRPWSFAIWDVIKDFFDREIKKLGVQNCYFPIFVSRAALEREKTHIADFAPEVAWVTKSGESDLAEPIAIRPTSETVMYPAYAKWLKSYRDLPLKLNQWNNVVRWEFKHPQPFLRTREFLWQEGHTAFATKAEADEEVLTILDLYAEIYERYLAIPVVKGRKTEKEKFAGGDYTTTVEAFVSASGRAIQGATSHHLGQNFSKMFDIQVEGADHDSEKIFVHQNSWGLTTRTIGVMVMVHGDDKGLVLPPMVASVQAVIVPCGITVSTTQEQRDRLMAECAKLEKELKENDVVRVKGDYRDNYSPGWKFNHWELKGVPLRIELGPKDLEKNQVTLVRRDNAQRLTTSRSNVQAFTKQLLDDIQSSLYAKAKTDLTEHIKLTSDWNEFCTHLDNKNLIQAPFCGKIECEDNIKRDSAREDVDEVGAPAMGAKSLCIPFEQPKQPINTLTCVHKNCNDKAKFFTLFGRSY